MHALVGRRSLVILRKLPSSLSASYFSLSTVVESTEFAFLCRWGRIVDECRACDRKLEQKIAAKAQIWA